MGGVGSWLSGSSSTVTFPTFMLNQFGAFLSNKTGGSFDSSHTGIATQSDFVTDWNTAYLRGNPYEAHGTAILAIDPDSKLNQMIDRVSQFYDAVDNIDAGRLSAWAFSKAAEIYDLFVQPHAAVEAVTDAFQARASMQYQRDVSGINFGYYDSRCGSLVQQAGALVQVSSDHQDRLTDMSARMHLQLIQQRDQGIQAYANLIIQLVQFRTQSKQAAAGAAIDTAKFWITAKQDQLNAQLDFFTRYITWDMDLYPRAWSAVTGLSSVPSFQKESRAQALLGGLTNSVSMALQLGTTLGGKTGLIAGLVGGGLNMAANMLSVAF